MLSKLKLSHLNNSTISKTIQSTKLNNLSLQTFKFSQIFSSNFPKNNNNLFFSIKKNNISKSLLSFSKQPFSEESKIIDEEETKYVETNKEQLGFKAETKKLLDIVTHSLYTDKEIFLRELLSNCSDALEKQRFMEVNGNLEVTGEPLFINITTNEKNRTVTIFDSGIGMTRTEMIDNLGTIAKSGTQCFVKNLREQKKERYSI